VYEWGPSVAEWYQIRYHDGMASTMHPTPTRRPVDPDSAAATLRRVRTRAGLSLRQLARRAGTSHSTLAAYEAGRVTPGVETIERIVRAAGFALDLEVSPRAGGADAEARGRELVAVLELAAQFPARHDPTLQFPRFGPCPI
jgi:transcriptional regulator with XRE-family HTH domain